MGNCRFFGISGYWGLAADILDSLKVKEKTDRRLFKSNLLAEFSDRGLTEDLFSYLNTSQVKGFHDHFVQAYNSDAGFNLANITERNSLKRFLSANCTQQIEGLKSAAEQAERDQATERTPIAARQW